jgi:large subunit ribosomal protein L9
MKIILLKDIAKVGRKYDIKDIKDGYALNMLIPRGMAIAATADAVKRIELERSKQDGERKMRAELLLKNIQQLDGVTITMEEKANEKGHLFAAIHRAELIPVIQKQTRLQVDEEYLILDKPLKEIGEHEIEVRAAGKSVKFKLLLTKKDSPDSKKTHK